MIGKAGVAMTARAARRLSMAVLVALIGGYGVELLAPDMPRTLGIMVGLLKTLALLGAIVLFLGASNLRARAPEGSERAFMLAHQGLVGGLIAILFYFLLGDILGFWLPNYGQIQEGITVFTLFSMALPTMIMAFDRR